MPAIQIASLRQQVYEVLRQDLNEGALRPGDPIRLDDMAARLGISRTPLREALLQLELEGFVVIKPRSGIRVRRLVEADIRNLYQMIGALESSVLEVEKPPIAVDLLARMRGLNEEMKTAVAAGDFDAYYAANLALHDAYLDLSDNAELVHQVRVMKQRLYDFTPRRDILQDWEEESTREHAALVSALEQGDLAEAARLVREVHWSYAHQERFIRKYYLPELAADQAGS
jgi:DNA-binding GntR family transcriptional regulator